ncbi:segregation/condensation protein A [Salarchaeum japonicum]|uniref:segregation/condensation protein A n=1 Tax=Salarchaeum japonicum TaxID=555573 RepID=UPI003C72D66B
MAENPEDALAIAGHDDREPPEGATDLFDAGGDESDADDEEEVEPVELLVQLAKEGEIAPWDIDIVDVTDAFLERLDEADLRTSGRALFYASVLLRMKSDALLEPDEPEEPEEPEPAPWEMAEGEDGGAPGFDPVDALEAEMDRRLERKDARGTPETLDELVRSLREAERGSRWKESRTYDTDGSAQGFQRGTQTLDYHTGDDMRLDDEPTEADALGTAHDEDIEATIEDVEDALTKRFDRDRTEVLYEEIAEAGGTRVETFLALLFLAHRGSVYLEQDEMFGDLWVSRA